MKITLGTTRKELIKLIKDKVPIWALEKGSVDVYKLISFQISFTKRLNGEDEVLELTLYKYASSRFIDELKMTVTLESQMNTRAYLFFSEKELAEHYYEDIIEMDDEISEYYKLKYLDGWLERWPDLAL